MKAIYFCDTSAIIKLYHAEIGTDCMELCQDRFLVNPLDSRIIRGARKLINKYGNKLSIRTLDALQLGSCVVEEQEGLHFVCADVRLNNICKLEGVSTINPETIDGEANDAKQTDSEAID